MTWTNRVVWQEGMFLRAQHFQQQDRHVDQLVRTALLAARPYGWDVTDMTIDRDLLATGRFALAQARGIFEELAVLVSGTDSAERLVAAACDRRATDNVTAVLVEVEV